MEKPHVLLAEDDYDFGSILKQYLEINGFGVTWAKDGKQALDLFQDVSIDGSQVFNICVLDVMMPKMDGFALAEKIIAINPEVPFIFLTAKKMKEDKIKGLKLGADDYVVKPFEADLLVLRLKNILKRIKQTTVPITLPKKQKIGEYIFDAHSHQLKLADEIQRITEKEAQLIQYFYQHKNQMIKREDLLVDVWGSDDFFSGRSMDVFISRLRKYFKEDPNIAIESTRGIGLTFKIND